MSNEELDAIAADLEKEARNKFPQVAGAAASEVLWSLAAVLKKLTQRRRGEHV